MGVFFFKGFRIDILLDGVSRGVFRPEVARDAEWIAGYLAKDLDLDGKPHRSMFRGSEDDLRAISDELVVVTDDAGRQALQDIYRPEWQRYAEGFMAMMASLPPEELATTR